MINNDILFHDFFLKSDENILNNVLISISTIKKLRNGYLLEFQISKYEYDTICTKNVGLIISRWEFTSTLESTEVFLLEGYFEAYRHFLTDCAITLWLVITE